MFFDELTGSGLDSTIDPRTTATNECKRLARAIERLARAVGDLKNNILRSDQATLTFNLSPRTQILHRKVSQARDTIVELLLLLESGMELLSNAECEGILDYQIAVL